MIEFLKNNYQWIFSGIGIFLVGIIWTLISRNQTGSSKDRSEIIIHFHGSESKENDSRSETQPVPIRRLSNLTPESIRATINSAPALKADQIKESFKGLFVEWETRLFSATEEEGSLVKLMLNSVENELQTIRCTVNLNEYRDLGVLQRGAKIRVVGKIVEAREWEVELDEVELFFHQ